MLCHGPFGVEVQHQRPHRRDILAVQPAGQSAQLMRLGSRVDQQLIHIHRHRPVPGPVAPLQSGQPIHPETGRLVAGIAPPERYIGLPGKIIRAAVVAAVVYEEEMGNAQPAVMLQEEWQPQHFIAQGREKQDVIVLDRACFPRNAGQFMSFAKGPPQQSLAAQAQFVCLHESARQCHAGPRNTPAHG